MSETALRCGELIGITFKDIDFKNKELRIDHQLTYKNYKDGNGCMFRIKKPKTKAGIRTIPLTDRACDAFREQRKQNFQAGIFCTFEIEGNGFCLSYKKWKTNDAECFEQCSI